MQDIYPVDIGVEGILNEVEIQLVLALWWRRYHSPERGESEIVSFFSKCLKFKPSAWKGIPMNHFVGFVILSKHLTKTIV